MFDSVLDEWPFGDPCPGGYEWARSGSRQHESDGTLTGECAVCRGRFRLRELELVPIHPIAPPLHEHPV
jgi:hypothetical protein